LRFLPCLHSFTGFGSFRTSSIIMQISCGSFFWKYFSFAYHNLPVKLLYPWLKISRVSSISQVIRKWYSRHAVQCLARRICYCFGKWTWWIPVCFYIQVWAASKFCLLDLLHHVILSSEILKGFSCFAVNALIALWTK
jgi:hypothetical protein